MRIKEKPRLELLYKQINVIIPCQLGQVTELLEMLSGIGEIDPAREYEIIIRPKTEADNNGC